jgi:hypothetical protein
LGETGDAGTNAMPETPIGDDLFEGLAVGRHIGPGANHAHRTQQDIEELRQLIEM